MCASKSCVPKELVFTGTTPATFCQSELLKEILCPSQVSELTKSVSQLGLGDDNDDENNNNNDNDNENGNNNHHNNDDNERSAAMKCVKDCTVLNFVTSKIHEIATDGSRTTGEVVYKGLMIFFATKWGLLHCCEKTSLKDGNACSGPASQLSQPDLAIYMKKDEDMIFLGIGEIKDTALAPLEQQGFLLFYQILQLLLNFVSGQAFVSGANVALSHLKFLSWDKIAVPLILSNGQVQFLPFH